VNLELSAPVSGHVVVTLSRRNLETLIKMLDHKTGIASLKRLTDEGVLLVRAEEDDEHYADRDTRGIGPEDI